MIQDHSRFHLPQPTPPGMNYVLKFLDQPVYSTPDWLDLHRTAIQSGYATLAYGCIFVLMQGVTIQHPRIH